MTQEQISKIKGSAWYYDARNRAELPGVYPNIEACNLQAYGLFSKLHLLQDLHIYDTEDEFVEAIGQEIYNDIMRDQEQYELLKAQHSILAAQQRLMEVLAWGL